SKTVEEHLGLPLGDLLEIPQGELTAALAITPDGKPAPLVFLDFGTKAESVQKLIEKLNEQAKEDELERAEEEFEDTRLVIYRKAAEEGNQPKQDAVAYFTKDTFLVAGSNAASLKSILNRWDGKHDNVLSESAVFRYIADKCRDEHQEVAP